MNDKVRKTLPLVGALALTAGALLAGTGAVAAKPEPGAVATSKVCDERSNGTETTTVYRVQYDLTANKGRWLYASAHLQVGPVGHPSDLDPSTRIDKNSFLSVEVKVPGTAQSATMVLTFQDRKGAVVGGEATPILWPECDPDN